ncbi:MAG: hypothetical protein M0008_01255 [Actinomycetota bacterium]|nr:hypothetical protein [Actinomycetota bacterium]
MGPAEAWSVGFACVKMLSVEIVSGAGTGRRFGVTGEAVRLWRHRPSFLELLGQVGLAAARDGEHIRFLAAECPKQATDRWGARGD